MSKAWRAWSGPISSPSKDWCFSVYALDFYPLFLFFGHTTCHVGAQFPNQWWRGKGGELPYPLQLTLPSSHVQPGRSLRRVLLGFLWRSHHIGMMDSVIAHSGLNSFSSPLPYPQLWKHGVLNTGLTRNPLEFYSFLCRSLSLVKPRA